MILILSGAQLYNDYNNVKMDTYAHLFPSFAASPSASPPKAEQSSCE